MSTCTKNFSPETLPPEHAQPGGLFFSDESDAQVRCSLDENGALSTWRPTIIPA
jgi:hypothetical protein